MNSALSNAEIYKRTFGFTWRRLVYDILAFAAMAVLAGIGYLITEKLMDEGLVGLVIGALIGLGVVFFVLRYVSYAFKAGQIAMITRFLTEGEVQGDVVKEGVRTVKERFLTVAAFFAATRIIKGIFRELGRVVMSIGSAIGGEKGGSVGSAISSVIQVIVEYLSDCCLGWVFFRSEESSAKATCEGAAIFFRHGKTLAKNLGRVFGIGLASLLLIGGVLTGIFYGIAGFFPEVFAELAEEISASADADIPAFFGTPQGAMLLCAAVAALVLWSILYSAFVKPFILTGVLRNYLESGIADTPDERSFALIDSSSRKFAKLHGSLA